MHFTLIDPNSRLKRRPTSVRQGISTHNKRCLKLSMFQFIRAIPFTIHQHAQLSFAALPLSPRFTLASSALLAAPDNAACVPPAAPPLPPFRLVSGIALAIAVKTSATFDPVFALVSKNSRLSSSAYAFA